MAETLGIVLASAEEARVHTAFLMAAGAAALGRQVVVFATGPAVRALAAEYVAAGDAGLRARGVAGAGELREAARQLGARLIACDSGLRAEGIEPAALLVGVTVDGLAAFLEATREGQMLSF